MRLIATLCFLLISSSLSALEQADRQSIQNIIQGYTDSWNQRDCKGFGDGFADDADFVNIFGMHFKGKADIEKRHIQIMQNFLKGSTLEILQTQMREAQPGVVIALVRWRCQGFRNPRSDLSKPGETREGIFTQVFIQNGNNWVITASQNTLIPN